MSQGNYQVEILSQEINEFELNFKIIIIGDSGVGKSCLSLRATKNIFESLYSPTIGFEFLTIFIKVDDKPIKLQIWDTCGQEVYRSLISSFYNNSSLAILVYSIENEDSFNNLEFWLNELRTKGNPDINIFLIGNKSDLEYNRKITKEMAQEFAENNKIKLFLETSAKTGFNARNIFIEAAKLLYEEHIKYKDNLSRLDSATTSVARFSNQPETLNIMTPEDDDTREKKGCCK
jgi:small GTP-binding protein